MLAEGHSIIPTQWIEVDKAEHKRRQGGPYVRPGFKSRLVPCGNFEKTVGLRSDSFTGDLEAINLVLSWAACNKLRVKSSDMKNAYFQGKPLDRMILMSLQRQDCQERPNGHIQLWRPEH